MTLRELLEILDKTSFQNVPGGCYKRLYLDIINQSGKRTEKEVSFNKISEVSNSILELNIVTVDKIHTRKFMFSNGVAIHLTVI